MAIAGLVDGRKEVVAVVPGYRESVESWSEVLRDLRDRGMNAPRLVIGDGHLGIWGALRKSGRKPRSNGAGRGPHEVVRLRGDPPRSSTYWSSCRAPSMGWPRPSWGPWPTPPPGRRRSANAGSSSSG
ncbi:MAG: transposase, partial [Armatimonadota bacterium]|nr:transposase [Armatimonadota bacterium]